MAEGRDIAGLGEDRPFRVRAETLEDLEVVSSMLQDAIVPLSEVAYMPAEQRFAMMTQRFRWERGPMTLPADEEEGEGPRTVFERIHCAVRIENVTGVRSVGIDQADRGQMLALLSLHQGEGHLDLAFAEGKTIRLATSDLNCHAEDIGEPWPTTQRPAHPEDEE